jgi:hypothetical protein
MDQTRVLLGRLAVSLIVVNRGPAIYPAESGRLTVYMYVPGLKRQCDCIEVQVVCGPRGYVDNDSSSLSNLRMHR